MREVRLLLHKDRDEASLTAEGLGRAEACPVAPLLREIDRARSAAAADDDDDDDDDAEAADDDGRGAHLLPPLRVSLCLRSPRSVIAACVPEWLRASGIAELVNGTVDVRADGALRPGRAGPRGEEELEAEAEEEEEEEEEDEEDEDEEDEEEEDDRGAAAASARAAAARRSSPSPASWGGFPPGCRLRVETKFAGPSTSALEASMDLLRELAVIRRVASLSVLSMAAPSYSAATAGPEAAAAEALRRGLRSFRALAETLQELRLAETVPAPVVRMALRAGRGDGEPGLRWPALRRMVLLGSCPDDPRDGGGPWRCFRRAAAAATGGGGGGGGRGGGGGQRVAGEEEEPLDLFPSLETIVVKREHSRAWLRRFGDAIDPARVTVERL